MITKNMPPDKVMTKVFGDNYIRTYILPPNEIGNKCASAFDYALRRIMQFNNGVYDDNPWNGRSEDGKLKVDTGDYTFIPRPCSCIVESLLIAKELKNSERKDFDYFYDMGSGLGNVLLIAYSTLGICNDKVIGVEKYDRGENKCYLWKPKIQLDIMKLEPKHMHEHSCIYLYNPLSCEKKMQAALDHLVKIAKKGSIIVFHYTSNTSLEKSAKKAKLKDYNFYWYGGVQYLYLSK